MSIESSLQRKPGMAGFALLALWGWNIATLGCPESACSAQEILTQSIIGPDPAIPTPGGILEPVMSLPTNPPLTGKTLEVNQRIEQIQNEIVAVRETSRQVEDDMQSLEKQIKLMGLTSSNQLVLTETRRGLPSISENQLRIKALSEELDQIGLNMHRLGTSSSVDQNSRLIEQYSEYRIQLGNLSVERERLIARIILLRQFLNGQLMWVRDCQPIGIAEFKKTAEGVTVLTAPRQWIELGKGLAERILFRPYEFGLLAIGLVAITFAKRWLAK